MNKSESIKTIAPALLEAQKTMTFAKKDAKNPFFKSRYADLNSVLEACKGPLNSNGITVLQSHDGDNVETVLLHSSGEWMSSSTRIVVSKQNDPQALGSAISYARRYGLQSFVSLPAEDDDGEKAVARVVEADTVALSTTQAMNSPATTKARASWKKTETTVAAPASTDSEY